MSSYAGLQRVVVSKTVICRMCSVISIMFFVGDNSESGEKWFDTGGTEGRGKQTNR